MQRQWTAENENHKTDTENDIRCQECRVLKCFISPWRKYMALDAFLRWHPDKSLFEPEGAKLELFLECKSIPADASKKYPANSLEFKFHIQFFTTSSYQKG